MNNVEINKQAKLSQHFTLGELCKTSVKTKDVLLFAPTILGKVFQRQ